MRGGSGVVSNSKFQIPNSELDRRPSLVHPLNQLLNRPTVDHAIGGHAGEPSMCKRRIGVAEFRARVRVAVDGNQTAGRNGPPSQLEIQILPCRIAVDLDRDPRPCGRGEDIVPPCRDAWT